MNHRRILNLDERLVKAAVREEHGVLESGSYLLLTARAAEKASREANILLPRNLVVPKWTRANVTKLTVRTHRWWHWARHVSAVYAFFPERPRRFTQYHLAAVLILLNDPT